MFISSWKWKFGLTLKETLVLAGVRCNAVETFLCSQWWCSVGVSVTLQWTPLAVRFLKIKRRQTIDLGRSRFLRDKTVYFYFHLIYILNCSVNFWNDFQWPTFIHCAVVHLYEDSTISVLYSFSVFFMKWLLKWLSHMNRGCWQSGLHSLSPNSVHLRTQEKE